MLRGESGTDERDGETVIPVCPIGYHFSFGQCVE